MVSREESNGQALSANARFFPTNGVPAPLEVLLRAGVARFADPTEHRLVELIRPIDAEIVCVAVRAERFDLLRRRRAGSAARRSPPARARTSWRTRQGPTRS